MSKKRIIGIIAVIIVVAAIAIGVKTFTSSGGPGGTRDHITIGQAMRDKTGQVVRAGGDVVPGSINWDDTSRSLRFTLTGEGDWMPVVYPGVAPSDFKPGSALVVEGTYASSGVFEATSITTRSSPLCKACHSG